MDYNEYESFLMEVSKSICYVCDVETNEMLYLSKWGMDICGFKDPEEYRGTKCFNVLQGLDYPCPFCTNDRLNEGEVLHWEHYNKNLNRWFELSDSIIEIDGRKCRVEIANDITKRKNIIDELSEQLTLEEILLKCINTLTTEKDINSAVNIFLAIIGKFYDANRSYLIEFDLKNQTTFNTFEWCDDGVVPQMENLQDIPMAYITSWIDKLEHEGEFYIMSLDKDVEHNSVEYQILNNQDIKSLMAAPLKSDGKIVGFLGLDDPKNEVNNFSLARAAADFISIELERRRLFAELEYISYTDVLTGIKNRNQYIRMLREYDWRALKSIGVVFVDINGLKSINDTHGYRFGDHVIKQAVKILQKYMGENVFRTGGDEFVALCENIDKEVFQEKVANLRKAFLDDKDCDVSLGCVWTEDNMDIESQVLQADELMYAEKQSYYRSALSEGRPVRTGFATEILADIENNKFAVHYQPQVDLKTGKIIGAEALVRKISDDGILVPPDKFIPFYEAEGVIRHLDLHVLESACKVVKKWDDDGYDLSLSVNFSRVTLMEPGIVQIIKDICDRYNVAAGSITIEVTESTNKLEQKRMKELAYELASKGFAVSLDDFGSQYSNLSALSTMEFDEIKFDKTLIDDIENNPKSQTVMKHSIQMCKALSGADTVSEGIESKGQMELLLRYNCDIGQGYYFSKPVSPTEFDVLLEKNKTESMY